MEAVDCEVEIAEGRFAAPGQWGATLGLAWGAWPAPATTKTPRTRSTAACSTRHWPPEPPLPLFAAARAQLPGALRTRPARLLLLSAASVERRGHGLVGHRYACALLIGSEKAARVQRPAARKGPALSRQQPAAAEWQQAMSRQTRAALCLPTRPIGLIL